MRGKLLLSGLVVIIIVFHGTVFIILSETFAKMDCNRRMTCQSANAIPKVYTNCDGDNSDITVTENGQAYDDDTITISADNIADVELVEHSREHGKHGNEMKGSVHRQLPILRGRTKGRHKKGDDGDEIMENFGTNPYINVLNEGAIQVSGFRGNLLVGFREEYPLDFPVDSGVVVAVDQQNKDVLSRQGNTEMDEKGSFSADIVWEVFRNDLQ